jgi:hypothetical protein
MGDSGAKSAKGKPANQTESGVTDSTGHSTLGKKVTKLSPTSGTPVTAKGDTLSKHANPNPNP